MLLKKSQSTAQPKSVIENSMEWINKDNASAISSENVNDKSLNNESKGAPLSCIKNIDHFFIYLFLISLVFTLGFIAGWFSMNHSFRFPVLKPSRKNVKISEEHQQYQIVKLINLEIDYKYAGKGKKSVIGVILSSLRGNNTERFKYFLTLLYLSPLFTQKRLEANYFLAKKPLQGF